MRVLQVWVRCRICRPTPTPYPWQVTRGFQPPVPTLDAGVCLPYTCLHSSKVSDLPSPLPPPSPAPRRLARAVSLCHLPPRLPPGPSPPWAVLPVPPCPHRLLHRLLRRLPRSLLCGLPSCLLCCPPRPLLCHPLRRLPPLGHLARATSHAISP